MDSIPPKFTNPAALLPGTLERKIRVLIVDDSPLISGLLEVMLSDAPDISVVGKASDGQEALRMAVRLRPDIITMDIRMPKMDGLEATRRIMALAPVPIVVVSSVYATDTNPAFSAIEAGALSVIEKPTGLSAVNYDSIQDQLISTIRTMSDVKVISRGNSLFKKNGVGPMTAMLQDYFTRPVRMIAIGASTGGPPVLMEIFRHLPKDFSVPIVVVQHILPTFVDGMVEWLNNRSALPVCVASEGMKAIPGQILLAPGNAHLVLTAGGFVHLDPSSPVNSQRPSVTRLFESVAKICGSSAVGILLTGMGEDGVDGLVAMSQSGAHIVAQNQATSVVFGMPGAAIRRHIVDEVLSPYEIVTRLVKLHRHIQTMGGI